MKTSEIYLIYKIQFDEYQLKLHYVSMSVYLSLLSQMR